MKTKPSINLLIPASIVATIALSACGGKSNDESSGKSKPEPTSSAGVWEQIQEENSRADNTYEGVWKILSEL